MKLGMIGLGRMGANVAQRLIHGGHQPVGFDPKPEARKSLEEKGRRIRIFAYHSGRETASPRTLWLMVPADAITDSTFTNLLPLLAASDTVIDGSND